MGEFDVGFDFATLVMSFHHYPFVNIDIMFLFFLKHVVFLLPYILQFDPSTHLTTG